MQNIRNVCILAHVDHGKTSLADVLLSSNGIISNNQAGDIRYLDSTIDEQQRGITMKSSSILLLHNYVNKLKSDSKPENYVVNLIDSPGHVDFSGEVNMALKLSDNAFVVVDVVEGVRSQTRIVIQQAWKERLNFILVLNKIDKLYCELHLTTTEAFQKLSDIIENVHHIIGELISSEVMEMEEFTNEPVPINYIADNYDTTPFHPLKGKVVFCSAYHHWGFRVSDFVPFYAKSLELDKQELYRKMWGDFYMNSKKQILKGAAANNRKNMFTSMILDQLWSLYDSFAVNDIDKIEKRMARLGLNVSLKRNVKQSIYQLTNTREALRSWLPLHNAILDTLVEKCPDPRAAMTEKKVDVLVPNNASFSEVRKMLKIADTSKDAPLLIYMAKLLLLDNVKKAKNAANEDNRQLVGLGRVYSGFARAGIKVFVFTARFCPFRVADKFLDCVPDDFEEGGLCLYENREDAECGENVTDVFVVELRDLYRFVGQEPLLLKEGASAGSIVGVAGLDTSTVSKNATLAGQCSLRQCLGAFSTSVQQQRIGAGGGVISVSVEPCKPQQVNELRDALLLLERSDCSVRVSSANNGEILLHTAGEIHLQKCLADLRNIIVPHIEFDVSEPIIPFRETVAHRDCEEPELLSFLHRMLLDKCLIDVPLVEEGDVLCAGMVRNAEELVDQAGIRDSVVSYVRLPQSSHTRLCVRVSVHPLPITLQNWIERNHGLFQHFQQSAAKCNYDPQQLKEQCQSLKMSLRAALAAIKEDQDANSECLDYAELLPRLWALGEAQFDRQNMLFGYMGSEQDVACSSDRLGPCGRLFWRAAVAGFQRALRAGPVCEEPVRGVAVVLHAVWEQDEKCGHQLRLDDEAALNTLACCNVGQFGAAVAKAVHTAMLCQPGLRLMIAMYKLELEVRKSVYKSLSNLLSQLHGQIVSQSLTVGDFMVEARLPVVSSLGFGQALRERTSGEVGLPQFGLTEWHLLDCHPLLSLPEYRALVDGVLLSLAVTNQKTSLLMGSAGTDLAAQNLSLPSLLFPSTPLSEELVSRTQNYINNVRRRKGLQVRQQLVEFGDKQRTLAKKK